MRLKLRFTSAGIVFRQSWLHLSRAYNKTCLHAHNSLHWLISHRVGRSVEEPSRPCVELFFILNIQLFFFIYTQFNFNPKPLKCLDHSLSRKRNSRSLATILLVSTSQVFLSFKPDNCLQFCVLVNVIAKELRLIPRHFH